MITSKQRSYLRKLANTIEPIFQVGKGGISPRMASEIEGALEARELIKVHVLDNCELASKEACRIMARMTKAEEVQVIGRKFVLYKPSRENPRIELP
jgi:RNA-binding protein